MATAYTPILQLALPVTGELNGTWGDVVNNNITSMVEQAIAGLATISTWTANSHTLTTANGTTDEARCAMLVATSTTAASDIICPNSTKLYVLKNASSYAVTLKTAAGTGVAVAAGDTAFLFCDGTNVNACVTQVVNGHITGNLTVDGNTTLGDASGDTVTVNAGATTLKAQAALRFEDAAGGEYVGIKSPATVTTYTLTLPAAVGSANQVLTTDASGNLSWATVTAGDVSGPASSGDSNIALFDGTTGKLLKNSGSIDGKINGLTIGKGGGNLVSNTAFGLNALSSNAATGVSNTAFGANALGANFLGTNNTAMGYYALSSATASTYSVAIGNQTLSSATYGGNNNVAVGYQAGKVITSGATSVAIGSGCLSANTTGTDNVAVGAYSMLLNQTGSSNTAVGKFAGRNGTVSYNTAVGYWAMYYGSTGGYNVAVGANALTNSTTKSNCVGVGFEALYYCGEGNNVAVGHQANRNLGFTAGTSVENVAVGYQAAYSMTNGANNTVIGGKAAYNVVTGVENTIVGSQALYTANGTSTCNAALGKHTLYYTTTGSYNTAIGTVTLFSATTASYNTACGYAAMYNTSTGSYNTALGRWALNNVSTGSGNIGIGAVDSAGNYVPAFDITTQNNYLSMGHTAITNAYVKVAWTIVSDARDKTNFAEVPHGLSFVNSLHPVAYQFRKNRESDEAVGNVRYGFKAQDILALEGDNPVIIDVEDTEQLRYNSDALVPVLVNAIQELTKRVEQLEAALNTTKEA